MLFEARDFDMDTIAMELNLYLDTILDIVFKHGKNRPIFFSSFSPELCFVLSNKQQIYPILFLTESGYISTRDIRATSFQEAVRFAKKWNLEGVAIRSQPLVAAPELIDLVKSSGLVCASWGDLNDEPESVKVKLHFSYDCSNNHSGISPLPSCTGCRSWQRNPCVYSSTKFARLTSFSRSFKPTFTWM
jgi:glycerophosphodiester phosphodiesterase